MNNSAPNNNPSPLWPRIKRFYHQKPFLAALLLFLGLIGMVIPVIPGIVLVILAIGLFKKGWTRYWPRKQRPGDG
jgi:hypothetical protein